MDRIRLHVCQHKAENTKIVIFNTSLLIMKLHLGISNKISKTALIQLIKSNKDEKYSLTFPIIYF